MMMRFASQTVLAAAWPEQTPIVAAAAVAAAGRKRLFVTRDERVLRFSA